MAAVAPVLSPQISKGVLRTEQLLFSSQHAPREVPGRRASNSGDAARAACNHRVNLRRAQPAIHS